MSPFGVEPRRPALDQSLLKFHTHCTYSSISLTIAEPSSFLSTRYLRNRTDCPEGLQKFWMGNTGASMIDLYDKIIDDVTFRKMWAEKFGFGFELSSVVPI